MRNGLTALIPLFYDMRLLLVGEFDAPVLPATAFSLLVYTKQPLPTRLFLKKSRTSLKADCAE